MSTILSLPLRCQDSFSRRAQPFATLVFVSALLLMASPASAVDVELFGVHKGQAFVQTGAGAPTPAGSSNYFFNVFVRAKRFNTLFGARVHPQGGVDRPLVIGHDFDFYNFWSATDFYASQAALDAAHPDTNYVLTLNTVNDGQVTVTFNLTGSAYPNAPHVANFPAAQAVRAEADFTLRWDAFTGGTTNDHIRIEIEDAPNTNNVPETSSPLGQRIFRTGDPRDVAALDGTATFVVLPAGTLFPGHNYRARITFAKVTGVDTNSYPQVVGVAGYVARTEFTLHTVDVRTVGVIKAQFFQQSDANAPVSQNFGLQAFLDARGTSFVSSATLQLPNGGQTIQLQATNDFNFKDNSATTSAQLDAAYPDGVYQVSVTTVDDGTKVFNLPVTNILASLATPHVSNFAAAQAVNPGLDFTLTWDALGGSTNDYVQVQVKQNQSTNGNSEVFNSLPPGVPGALNGTNTSVTIPAFTLQPGTTYSASLMFARLTGPFDTNSYPGAVGIPGDFKLVSFTVRTPDVRRYTLNKRQDFLQTNNAAPVAFGPSNFVANAHVKTPGTNNVTSATLTVPGSGVVPLPASNDFEIETNFTSQSALDAFAPAGTYQFSITTVNDGNKTLNLTIPATVFPNAPQVNGYDLLQLVNPHRFLLITWNSFSGGTTNDFIRLEIQEANNPQGFSSGKVFSSPFRAEFGVLNGTNTAVLLPPNTLQPGKDYTATLSFVKVCTIDTNSYPGAVGGAGFVSDTTFNIHTRGSHPSAPLMGGIIRSNTQTFLQFFGETNRQHRIDVVSDLRLKNWAPLMTNAPAFDGSNSITDGQAAGNVRFYRVVPLFQ